MSSIEQRRFEFVDATDADFPGTSAEVLAIPSRDRNLSAFASSGLDIASEPSAKLDEQSCLDALDDDFQDLDRELHASCEDSALQSPTQLTAD